MPHLSQADQEAVFAALRDLYAETELGALREQMLRLVSRLVPNDWASYNELAPDDDHRSILNIRIPDSVDIQRCAPGLLAHIREHPNVQLDPVRAATALTLSDFYSWRELTRTNMFNEYYRHVGVRYQLFFSFDGGQGTKRAIGINRGRCDFSNRDRAVGSLLSPHFAQAYANAVHCERLQALATAVENPSSPAVEIALCLGADDRVETLSCSARQWVSRHLGITLGEGSPLPDAIAEWLRSEDAARNQPEGLLGLRAPLRMAGPRGEVCIRIAHRRAGGSAVLFLRLNAPLEEITPLALPELTRRENEVLAWIAQGKSNREIAVILGLSVRTVYKHVENLFAKLGVESRGQAMLRALSPR